MTTKTAQSQASFTYRLRRKMFTPKMKRVLLALDEWRENNPSVATCKQIADLAQVSQTYVQSIIRCLEAEGYVKLWRKRDGTLKAPESL